MLSVEHTRQQPTACNHIVALFGCFLRDMFSERLFCNIVIFITSYFLFQKIDFFFEITVQIILRGLFYEIQCLMFVFLTGNVAVQ